MALKEIAKQVIDTLPEDATMDDIIHALYVNIKFDRGQQEILKGQGIPHKEAKRRLQKWLK